MLDVLSAAAWDTSPDGVAGRLAFTAQYVAERPEAVRGLETASRESLEAAVQTGLSQSSAYEWARLARTLTDADPVGVARLAASYVTRARGTQADPALERLPNALLEVLLDAARARPDAVFAEVLGPLIDDVPLVFWRLESVFDRDPGLLSVFDPARLAEWAGEREERLMTVAHAVPVQGAPLTPLARELLVRYPGDDRVAAALTASFQTGDWWGPMSSHIREKLAVADAWICDDSAAVQRWARRVREHLMEQLRDAEAREALEREERAEHEA